MATPDCGYNEDELLLMALMQENMFSMNLRLPEIHEAMDRSSLYGLAHRGEMDRNYFRAASKIRNYCRGRATEADLAHAIKELEASREVHAKTNGKPPNIGALVLLDLNLANAYKLLGDTDSYREVKARAEEYIDELIQEEVSRVQAKYQAAEKDILECLYKR